MWFKTYIVIVTHYYRKLLLYLQVTPSVDRAGREPLGRNGQGRYLGALIQPRIEAASPLKLSVGTLPTQRDHEETLLLVLPQAQYQDTGDCGANPSDSQAQHGAQICQGPLPTKHRHTMSSTTSPTDEARTAEFHTAHVRVDFVYLICIPGGLRRFLTSRTS